MNSNCCLPTRVFGLNPRSGLSVWSLYVLPVQVCVFSAYSSFLPQSKNLHVKMKSIRTQRCSECCAPCCSRGTRYVPTLFSSWTATITAWTVVFIIWKLTRKESRTHSFNNFIALNYQPSSSILMIWCFPLQRYICYLKNKLIPSYFLFLLLRIYSLNPFPWIFEALVHILGIIWDLERSASPICRQKPTDRRHVSSWLIITNNVKKWQNFQQKCYETILFVIVTVW